MAISEADWTRQLARSNPAHRLLIARAPALFAEARLRPAVRDDARSDSRQCSESAWRPRDASARFSLPARSQPRRARYFSRADIWHRLVDRAIVLALAKHKRILVVRRLVCAFADGCSSA